MTTTGMIGLLLQLLGTGLAGWALWGEFGSAPPAVKVPKRPRVENPWDGELRSKGWGPRRSRIQRWESEKRNSLGAGPVHPDVVAVVDQVSEVFGSVRTKLRGDWERQERGAAELHAATVALFDTLQTAHADMRGRVRREMVGLVLVVAGTVVSAL